MNDSTHVPAPLKFAVSGLGVAVAVLAVLWSQQQPTTRIALSTIAASSSESDAGDTSSPKPAQIADAPMTDARQPAPTPENTTAAAASPALTDYVLYGTVRRADGALVEAGSMQVHRDGRSIRTATLRDGTFAFAWLDAGAYRLTIQVADELPFARHLVLTQPRTRVDLRLDATWVLMVHAVTPDGRPLAEALGPPNARLDFVRSMSAYASEGPLDGDLVPSTMNRVRGRIGGSRAVQFLGGGKPLPKTAVGVLALPVGEPMHVALLLHHVVVAQCAVTPGQAELTFTVSPDDVVAKCATVRVRVVDEVGAPVQGVSVALNDRQRGGGGVTTDANGVAVLTPLIPGRLGLQVRSRDAIAPPLIVDVAPGANLDLGDIRLLRPVVVDVVADELGEGATVRVCRLDPAHTASASADSYSLAIEPGQPLRLRLYPGRHLLVAASRTVGAILELDTRALPPQPIRLPLGKTAPLTIATAERGTTARLELRHASGAAVRDFDLASMQEFAVDLPLGDYTVRMTNVRGVVTEATLTIDANGKVLRVP